MQVLWQTKSRSLRDAIAQRNGGLIAQGGRAYEYSAAMDIAERYPVGADDACVREDGESYPAYLYKIARHANHDADALYVIDPFVLASGKRTRAGTTISVVHHVDTRLMHSSPAWRLFFAVLLARLKNLDRVVTVSQFWKEYLENRGCRNVSVIYNSFDPAEFEFGPDDGDAFRREHGLPLDKRLVYIGNAQQAKGVVQTHEALCDKPYILIMSGPKRPGFELPVLHLDLPRRDYLRLLAAADVVVTMSTMAEGWNRTAHEAMLCRTPVVGSGSGGMLELLTKGGQLVAESFEILPERVEQAVAESDERVKAGYAFATTLDSAYRRESWLRLMAELASERPAPRSGSCA